MNIKELFYKNNNVHFVSIGLVLNKKKSQESSSYILLHKIRQSTKIKEVSEPFPKGRLLKLETV